MFNDQQGNISLGLIAGAGWALSVILILYGIFIYGPNQFDAGVVSGTNPVSQNETTLPDGSPVIIPRDLSAGLTGEVQEVNETGMIVQTFDPENPAQTISLSIIIDDETEIYSRQFISAAPESIDEVDEIQGGLIEEVQITKTDLQTGDQVDVRYVKENGSYHAVSISRN